MTSSSSTSITLVSNDGKSFNVPELIARQFVTINQAFKYGTKGVIERTFQIDVDSDILEILLNLLQNPEQLETYIKSTKMDTTDLLNLLKYSQLYELVNLINMLKQVINKRIVQDREMHELLQDYSKMIENQTYTKILGKKFKYVILDLGSFNLPRLPHLLETFEHNIYYDQTFLGHSFHEGTVNNLILMKQQGGITVGPITSNYNILHKQEYMKLIDTYILQNGLIFRDLTLRQAYNFVTDVNLIIVIESENSKRINRDEYINSSIQIVVDPMLNEPIIIISFIKMKTN